MNSFTLAPSKSNAPFVPSAAARAERAAHARSLYHNGSTDRDDAEPSESFTDVVDYCASKKTLPDAFRTLREDDDAHDDTPEAIETIGYIE